MFAGTQTVVCQYAHQLKKVLHVVKLFKLYARCPDAQDAFSCPATRKFHAPGHPFKITITEFFLGVDFVMSVLLFLETLLHHVPQK